MADPNTLALVNRLLGAFLLPLLVSLAVFPAFIRQLQIMKWGQEIRPEGPEDHLSKKGTPTMGGLVLLLTFVASTAVGCWPMSPTLGALLAYTLANGVIGFVDDFTQIRMKRSLGLKARQKLLLQNLFAAGFVWVVIGSAQQPFWVPGLGLVTSPLLHWMVALLLLVGTSNAVNLTDGLDGLAAGTMVASSLAYMAVAATSGHPDIAVSTAAMIGACAGFLWFNAFPARIFMGDTGALALGSYLGGVALITHTDFLMVLIGGVFVMESLSVMIQVAWFKATKGKRIFRMAPIHHHFCKGGLHEVQVTTRLWLTSALLGGLGVWLYLSGLTGATLAH